jgi:hypothetical protein
MRKNGSVEQATKDGKVKNPNEKIRHVVPAFNQHASSQRSLSVPEWLRLSTIIFHFEALFSAALTIAYPNEE